MDNIGGLFEEVEKESEDESEEAESEEDEGSFIALDDSNVTMIFNNIQVNTRAWAINANIVHELYIDCCPFLINV